MDLGLNTVTMLVVLGALALCRAVGLLSDLLVVGPRSDAVHPWQRHVNVHIRRGPPQPCDGRGMFPGGLQSAAPPALRGLPPHGPAGALHLQNRPGLPQANAANALQNSCLVSEMASRGGGGSSPLSGPPPSRWGSRHQVAHPPMGPVRGRVPSITGRRESGTGEIWSNKGMPNYAMVFGAPKPFF